MLLLLLFWIFQNGTFWGILKNVDFCTFGCEGVCVFSKHGLFSVFIEQPRVRCDIYKRAEDIGENDSAHFLSIFSSILVLSADEQIKVSVNSPLLSTLNSSPCLNNFCHAGPVYTMERYWLIFSCIGHTINCFCEDINLIICPSSSST